VNTATKQVSSPARRVSKDSLARTAG